MVIIIFLFLFFLYVYLFSNDDNFYKLIIKFGPKGVGKTTDIFKESQEYIKDGYRVYCNIEIPGTYLYNPLHVGLYTFPKESVVFCDELSTYWNNRDYKNFAHCLVVWFKLQRHYKIRFIGYDQSFTMDVTLRRLVDQVYFMRRLGRFCVQIPVIKKQGIATDQDGNGQFVDSFKYGSIFGIKFTYLPRYYGLFDSFVINPLPEIKATYQDYNEFQKMCSSTKMWIFYNLRNIYLKVVAAISKFLSNSKFFRH